MNNYIDNNQDIIDSRDVVVRIEELKDERQSLVDGLHELQHADHIDVLAVSDAQAKIEAWDHGDEEGYLLKDLMDFASEGEGYGDWQNGETLIRESYFMNYAQELAEDIGAIKPGAQWPYNCIDWERAANELKIDYTELDFGGITYLMWA